MWMLSETEGCMCLASVTSLNAVEPSAIGVGGPVRWFETSSGYAYMQIFAVALASLGFIIVALGVHSERPKEALMFVA